MKKIFLGISLVIMTMVIISCGESSKKYLADQEDGLFAAINVNKKIILVKLYYEKTPLTVTNFVGLATGKFENYAIKKGNFYNGLTFHRVVENFVIQGGDPNGDGSGNPGYSFVDEFDDTLTHDSKGILSMANSGPDTNGSQFFITLGPARHLDNKHSIFGKVVAGEPVVFQVQQNDTITSIKIYPKGEKAESFVNNISWDFFQELVATTKEKKTKALYNKKDTLSSALENDTTLTKTKEGIYYSIIQEGIGNKIKDGDSIEVHYELKIYGNEEVIDSSYTRNTPFAIQEVGKGAVIPGWDLILRGLRKGQKIRAVIPPELAYGERGVGNQIPPESFLDFIIEIVDIK